MKLMNNIKTTYVQGENNVVAGRFQMRFDRNCKYSDPLQSNKSYSMSEALKLFGKARRPHWHQGTHIFYKGQEIIIEFGDTTSYRPFVARKDDLNAMDWVEYKIELCPTCTAIEKLSKDKIPSLATGRLYVSKSAETMIEHLHDFHPCTCKK